MKRFPFYKQPDKMSCGATCLRIIAKHYGKTITVKELLDLTSTSRQGTSVYNILEGAKAIGFNAQGVKANLAALSKKSNLPCIVHWKNEHFVIVYKTTRSKVYVSDPAYGLLKYDINEFLEHWIDKSDTTNTGVAIFLEPNKDFTTVSDPDKNSGKKNFYFKNYLFSHKKHLIQLVIGLIIGSAIQLVFPFLTQSIVDVGIKNQDLNFVYIILIAQLFLFLGRVAVEVIRAWIILHLSTRINITLISDFFIKLMNLPISFFDSKKTSDILQRIEDHHKIESLLTSTSLSTLFSIFSLIVFSVVLFQYDLSIFLVFLVGSILYFIWVALFLKRRKDMEYKRFSQLVVEQSKVIELISGIEEIKLHNAENQQRWSWEKTQANLFKVSTKSLSLEQTMTTGASFINELKNIFITILSAKLVINGEITLGMMMSISFIVGQLNSPIQQLLSFIYSFQDAMIAIERLTEIHGIDNEEDESKKYIHSIQANEDLVLSDIYFKYPGVKNFVINGISLTIPVNKTTAIVGSSGSGKTTLMKLLLKYYQPDSGEIKIGTDNLNIISQKTWRSHCSAVVQDGYIFNDTIERNIALGEETIDEEKLIRAVKIANIGQYIQNLALGFKTVIGEEGTGMSAGQRQRILIARAVYKNPSLIFFDEATSALDANNEREIMGNLNLFIKGRTAVIIAHRLSTVKNADQIIVLDDGKIIETGTHEELVASKGNYYQLVKNQLELDS